jgi:transcription elongation GreA/GreB family factor
MTNPPTMTTRAAVPLVRSRRSIQQAQRLKDTLCNQRANAIDELARLDARIALLDMLIRSAQEGK